MHLKNTIQWRSIYPLICLALLFFLGCTNDNSEKKSGKKGPTAASVEIASVQVEDIELRRSFSGSLEAIDRFVVASRVGGRLVRLAVDLADPVTNGQVVAELDDQEFQQAVNQAQAELAVAEANLVEARNNLEIARREMERQNQLKKSGFATEAEIDGATARLLAREAGVEVASAQAVRAKASLAAARIRLDYTVVAAKWSGEGQGFVAQRHVDVGATLSANTPLLSIVALDPMIAVIYVTEKDYGLLEDGQSVTLRTDAFPGKTFQGKVARVAPVFNRASRQARVEIEITNKEQLLKPGMFVNADVLLGQARNATTLPLAALVNRGGETGVFLVNETGDAVSWRVVETGIRQGERVQVLGSLNGSVVTLGQQLLEDGSSVIIPQRESDKEKATQ